MSRKNFAKGIDAILGSSEEEKDTNSSEAVKEDNKELLSRTSLYIEVESYEQLKAIAYWERRSVTSVVQEAFDSYIDSKGKKYVNDAKKKYLESMSKE